MPVETASEQTGRNAPPGQAECAAGQQDVNGRDPEGKQRWALALGLPCELTVDVPLPGFRIGDLARLRAGSVINTSWPTSHDVPLRINGTLIGWSEFETVHNRLAVRLTELA